MYISTLFIKFMYYLIMIQALFIYIAYNICNTRVYI